VRPPYDAALVLGVELDADDAPTEELARRVMIVRQDRLIDAFLYASVTPAYLTAALDAL